MTLSHRLLQQHILALAIFFSTTIAHSATVTYSYDDVGNRLQLSSLAPAVTVYEDGEDGNIAGWEVYDNDPEGATISNVYDSEKASRVIELFGSTTANGYRLRNPDGSYWQNSLAKAIGWSMKYSENFTVYIATQTKDGFRYIYYTPVSYNNLGDSTYIHHGLGTGVKDGNWHTFVRDLEYDLKDAQPDNELEAVLGFLIRGSGRVDDIQTMEMLPANLDSDSDGLYDIDEMGYGTSPYSADSDHDGINDLEEINFWGSNWNSDSDNDGLINLLDGDSDNDGVLDGAELSNGSDPADGGSIPAAVNYEDGENGNVAGWDVYDNDPAGATITNTYDNDKNSNVIEFAGSATSNGYRLRNIDGSYWSDTNFNSIAWSMKYSENFTIYIAAQTTNGFRYIYYTPATTDSLGDDTYIHHGLGTAAKDGSWHTFIRDIEHDLKDAQPDNELQAILGFLIRGSGKVDDIRVLHNIPDDQDSDNDGITDNEEISSYTTNPYRADSDNDALDDLTELNYWGALWNVDSDGDGSINIIDPDSDNDLILDGIEVSQGYDPADATDTPDTIIYENAEDGSTAGWEVYDQDPAGATIANVFDSERANTVIELSGTGTSNGYRLKNSDGSYWYDSLFTTISWSHKYSESFVVYIAAQTTDGFRYIYYTPAATDNLGTETYIHHGLGASAMDGSWQTFTRDLQADLKDAQPDNELEAVLGFLIRGSGRVDDISTGQ